MNKSISELNHVQLELPGGGLVFVVDTGALINPESLAMIQALHSRSIEGIRGHLRILKEKGSEKFMGTFYVGYGHASIGDCGFTTIFIEGVSMLVAKAIQDSQLYNGQEASTRYINFETQPFIDPMQPRLTSVLMSWRKMYTKFLPIIREHVRTLYPLLPEYDTKDYERATNARAFDIIRGFLPAGAATNLAWTVNLRQAHDRICLLRHHPLAEVRIVAEKILECLKEAHPNSFGQKLYPSKEGYNALWMRKKYYFDPEKIHHEVKDRVDRDQLAEWKDVIKSRPEKVELPKQIAECGVIQFNFPLDFGSFRDIQRQRSVAQRMPRLTARHGFHPWYLESLPNGARAEMEAEANNNIKRVIISDVGIDYMQYYLPMGLLVPCRLTGDLPAHTYIVELRAQSTVHPTLHREALWMATELEERFGEFGLHPYVDTEIGRFNVKRGKQTIEVRG